ncbi:vacuolar protein sorting-associated protein 8 homolog [Mercenaria mercenaria]|uniref:vacuolar protein sorting-associated protein 8 homolog n=1 Tax=Mercenaria mercenaria TaxID=6596 RepID=UPI00234EF807|nr:vacuolar protein sorting-associated protein 8 homolog [Mercenaria mercenaria]
MFPQRRIKDIDNKDILSDFKQLIHHVLKNMMGYIAPPAILQKIMQDPAYNTGKFGEIRELILGMLETYNYEKTLMITCKNLLNHDIHDIRLQLRSLTNAAMKGYILRGDQCKICEEIMNQPDIELVMVFRCSHIYHSSCLQAIGSVHCIVGEDTYVCYLCSHTKRGQTQCSRFHRYLSNPQTAQMLGLKTEKAKELGILTENAKSESSARTSRTTSCIFQQEQFQLNVAAPRIFD